MRIDEIIIGLEQEIAEYAITDQALAVKEILGAPIALFFDSCFVSRLKQLGDDTKIIKLFRSMGKNGNDGKIAIVLSSLVLYEMRDTTYKLSIYEKKLLYSLSIEGFKIIVLREESLSKHLSEYTNYSTVERNTAFVKKLCDNKANLSKLSRIVYSNASTRKVYDFGFAAPNKATFIADFITDIKEMKETGDSLAEELIVLSIMLLAELPSSRLDIMCTNDLLAIARLNKSICTSLMSERKRISAMSMFTAVQAMIQNGIVNENDKAVLMKILSASVGKSVYVTEVKEPPLHSIEVHIGIGEVIEGMYAGKGYVLKGKQM